MRYAIHYGLAGICGLATPLLMIFVTEAALACFTAGNGEIWGHATPVEYLLPFGLTGLVVFGVFLTLNFISVRRLLPEGAFKIRHFLLALLLYLVVGVCGIPGLIALENLLGWLVFT